MTSPKQGAATPGPFYSVGPYRADESSDGKETAFYADDDSALCEPVFIVPHDDVTELGMVEVRANIALLRAAPAMHEALQRGQEYLQRIVATWPESAEPAEIRAQFLAALAAAGQPS
jgi:hypothetical protein